MKKIIVLVFCFLSINCNKKKIEKPLFLDFYPTLSNEEFEEKISELTKKGILEKGYFNILIKNNKIPFSIGGSNGSVLPKSITLNHSEDYNEKKQLTEKLKINFNHKIVGITELLKNKYPLDFKFKNLNDFQTKKTINKYNDFFYYIDITNDTYDYMVFRDTSKTIVLSYSQLRNINIKSKESTLSINIGYFYNSDFDSILNENINFKIREKEIKLEEEKEKIKELKLKQEILKKNNENL